jgi:hypothetical protein
MRAFAIKRLDPLTSCIDRVVLAHQFEVSSWLPQAYVDVCELSRLPSTEDAHRLGFDVFIKIATAREAFRLSSDVVETSKRAAIVKDVFDVSSTPLPECKSDTPVSSEEAANILRPLNPAASPFVAAVTQPKAETLPLPKIALSSPSVPILKLLCPKPTADVPWNSKTSDPSSSTAAAVEAEVTASPKRRPPPRSRVKLPTPVVESPNASVPAPSTAKGISQVVPPASTSRAPSRFPAPAPLSADNVLRSVSRDYSATETSRPRPPPPPLVRTKATVVKLPLPPPPPRRSAAPADVSSSDPPDDRARHGSYGPDVWEDSEDGDDDSEVCCAYPDEDYGGEYSDGWDEGYEEDPTHVDTEDIMARTRAFKERR